MCTHSIWCLFLNFDCALYIEVKVGSLWANGMMEKVPDYNINVHRNDHLIKVFHFEYVERDRVSRFHALVIQLSQSAILFLSAQTA